MGETDFLSSPSLHIYYNRNFIFCQTFTFNEFSCILYTILTRENFIAPPRKLFFFITQSPFSDAFDNFSICAYSRVLAVSSANTLVPHAVAQAVFTSCPPYQTHIPIYIINASEAGYFCTDYVGSYCGSLLRISRISCIKYICSSVVRKPFPCRLPLSRRIFYIYNKRV